MLIYSTTVKYFTVASAVHCLVIHLRRPAVQTPSDDIMWPVRYSGVPQTAGIRLAPPCCAQLFGKLWCLTCSSDQHNPVSSDMKLKIHTQTTLPTLIQPSTETALHATDYTHAYIHTQFTNTLSETSVDIHTVSVIYSVLILHIHTIISIQNAWSKYNNACCFDYMHN